MRHILVLFFLVACGNVIRAQDVPNRETEAQTIARCLNELNSDDVELRRRAAMVIGKYSTPEAIQAVVKCLKDPDSKVRQSALVSLTEERGLPPEARMSVFHLLSDTNVHIRRLASAILPEAIGVSLRGNILLQSGVRIKAGGGRGDAENTEILKCLNDALDDEDPSVRRNVLQASRYLPMPLDMVKLERFFKDSDAEVRILALMSYSMVRGHSKERAAALEVLLGDKSPRVRQELANTLFTLGWEGTSLLKKLVKDPDMNVSVSAVAAFAKQITPEAYPYLAAKILDKGVPVSKRLSLCNLLRLYPDKAGETLNAMLDGESQQLKAEAVKLLASGRFGEVDERIFFKALEEDNADVRKQALYFLRRKLTEPTAGQLKQFMSSKYPDIRIWAVSMLNKIPKTQEQSDIILDACMDDSKDVRASAFRIIGGIKPDGWEDILLATLEDGDMEIVEIAVTSLCMAKPSEQITSALEGILPKCKSRPVIMRVENYLRRAKRLKK